MHSFTDTDLHFLTQWLKEEGVIKCQGISHIHVYILAGFDLGECAHALYQNCKV